MCGLTSALFPHQKAAAPMHQRHHRSKSRQLVSPSFQLASSLHHSASLFGPGALQEFGRNI